MLIFLLGGGYTLVILVIGMLIGWSLGEGRTEADESIDIVRFKPKVESGSLKPYTKEELANQKDTAVKKMGEIFQGFRDDK